MTDWIQYHSALSLIACLVGLVIAAANVPSLVWPRAVRTGLLAFPRSRVPAWLLTVVDLSWVAWIILHAQLGRFEWVKPWIYGAAPVAFFLLVIFMDELLAPRALGGFLLLLANPVINAARWHESELRLVMVALAYLWVVAGMVLVLSPYYFRRVAEWATRSDDRCRFLGLARIMIGLALLGLGLWVY